jgi:hypothetical protein
MASDLLDEEKETSLGNTADPSAPTSEDEERAAVGSSFFIRR